MSKQTIPYHRPYPLADWERELVKQRINECLQNGQLTNGYYVNLLENEIKGLYNVDYCIATSNCTMGLMLCLEFIPKKYYIQTTAFNWWSDKYVLEFLNKDIAWNDIDKETWLPIVKHGGYNLYVHTFGSVGEDDPKNTIYDASHCLGTNLIDVGIATLFSLAPTKLVTACEGGFIITNNKELYEFAKERRDKMCRMSEVHAIVGLQTLKHLDEIIQWKAKVYNYYRKHIPGQFQKVEYDSNFNTIGFLNENNLIIPEHIETRRYYEPIRNWLENTEYVYNNIVCLPSWYGVDYKQVVEDILNENNC